MMMLMMMIPNGTMSREREICKMHLSSHTHTTLHSVMLYLIIHLVDDNLLLSSDFNDDGWRGVREVREAA
jgi:hypothetical protein